LALQIDLLFTTLYRAFATKGLMLMQLCLNAKVVLSAELSFLSYF